MDVIGCFASAKYVAYADFGQLRQVGLICVDQKAGEQMA